LGPPLRRQSKQSDTKIRIFSSAQEENVMPTVDLLLPPRAYSRWHPKERRQPIHLFAGAVVLIGRWIERTRQRQALAELDDHMLRDIGVTRVEAARECRKPFWR
jgi:uncharacterized protein YjiS (DUF1127 family)